MENLVNELYSWNSSNKFLQKIKLFSVWRNLIKIIFNIIMPIWYKLRAGRTLSGLTTLASPKVIVSLTTFPKRINRIWIVIESILNQTIGPDKIILWLSEEQFKDINDLPSNLLKLTGRGLDIRFVKEDLKSYKKYYYSFKEYPNDIIITVDDDIIYPNNMIANLLLYHQKYPNAVICRYCYEMKREGGVLLSYNNWDLQTTKEEIRDKELFFGSGGGVLFPPLSCYKDVTNENLFKNLCKSADDVWLNAMVQLNHTRIVKCGGKCVIFPVLNKDDIKLFSENICQNDIYISNVRDYYNKAVF